MSRWLAAASFCLFAACSSPNDRDDGDAGGQVDASAGDASVVLHDFSIGDGPLSSVQAGTWTEILDSKLNSVLPSPAPDGDPSGIMDAWSGGVYDSGREQLVIWGGGHVDYAGNEVYTFGPLTRDHPKWTRRTTPSAAQTGCSATYTDGLPSSSHTYNTLAYDAVAQKMYSMGLGSIYNCGSEDEHMFAFDLVTNQWDVAAAHPATNGGAQGSSADFDPTTGLTWRRGSGDRRLQSYSAATNTFVDYDDGFGYMSIEFVGAIDSARKLMVAAGGYEGKGPLGNSTAWVVVWDLASPAASFKAKTSGGAEVESRDSLGFQFHPPSGTFIAWFGGGAVWRLSPPADLRNGTWAWTKIPPAPGSPEPPAENARGTYGRFRYVPTLDVFVAVNAIDQNVWVYRLP